MPDTSAANNSQMQKAFAEKIKNMVGIIQKSLQSHGGNIELVGVDKNNTVKVRLQCDSANCPEGQEVFETGVKQLFKQRIPEVGEVIAVD